MPAAVDIRGRGRPWHTKLKPSQKRTVLVGLRITPEDEKRLEAILVKLSEEEKVTAATYAYVAVLKAMDLDERRLARRKKGSK